MEFAELQQNIKREIDAERKNEIQQFLSEKREALTNAKRKLERANSELRAMNISMDRVEAFNKTLDEEREEKLKEIKERHQKDSDQPKRISITELREHALNVAVAPEGVKFLPTSFAGTYSTADPEDKLSGGTGTEVFNPNVIDAWCWARGDGNGWFGSGAGSYQVWAEWGFWFRPETSKYYSIIPHNVFHGFYIVISDDGFWTSKYAHAVVSVWTNVWQYNWKGWTNVNVLDIGGDNIYTNHRFDTERHTYYASLLGGGDWAYIRNVVGLYVYARGSGSYAELNFATGAANYLTSPHVHVY
jgi:hypothetical protein